MKRQLIINRIPFLNFPEHYSIKVIPLKDRDTETIRFLVRNIKNHKTASVFLRVENYHDEPNFVPFWEVDGDDQQCRIYDTKTLLKFLKNSLEDEEENKAIVIMKSLMIFLFLLALWLVAIITLSQ